MFDSLKKKIRSLPALAALGKLRNGAAPAQDIPEDAKYGVGDIIPTTRNGLPFGDFKVLGVKAGGYALVYFVADEKTGARYALKTFRDWCFDKAHVVERFTREAETLIRLGKHPHIVYAHAVFHLHGRPHILLEYVDGADLWDKVKRGPLPVSRALKYAIQFCCGMAHAQSKIPGLVHRDVKPPNCLITKDRVLKITDFGHVKVPGEIEEEAEIPPPNGNGDNCTDPLRTPQSHWGVGTPIYMAPEQFSNYNKTDFRSDIYSFGIMLFEMLTGERPFKGEKHEECYYEHRTAAPPDPVSLNPQIPRPVADLVLSCLAKSPAERPESFEALEDRLSDILRDNFQKKIPCLPPGELTNEELINRGTSLTALGRYAEALICFNRVLAVEPESARAWGGRGEALTMLGSYGEALACFDRALSLDPQATFALSNKGAALNEQGHHEEALVCFDRALSLNPQLTFVWNLKGHTLAVLDRLDESLMCLEQAIATDSLCAETYHNLGLVYNGLGRHAEAVEAYQQAARINPRSAEAHKGLGDSYAALERFTESVASYNTAINLKPDYPEARRNMETAQFALRRQEEAANEVLETDRRLSECLLWRLREDFYDKKGVSAWEQIPYYPTSNPFIGEAYAELVIAFLLDYRAHLNRDEPVYIIEMAAGTGCFSFYMLKALMAKLAYFGDLRALKVRYVMTDFTESNIKFWEGHEKLQAFRDAGVLDFTVWRPEDEDTLFLRTSRTRLCAETVKNPVIAIANYFFDSIRQDGFRIMDGKVQEVRFTFYRDKEAMQAGDSVTLEQLKMHESYVDAGDSYYPDHRLNAILNYYRDVFDKAAILFPLGAFDCIRNLQSLSGNNLMLLSSDKGFTTTEHIEAYEGYAYTLHDSVFSYMVNYHAISRYFVNQGGHTFSTTDDTHYLHTTMNTLLRTPCELENSRYYFQEKVRKQNLINYLYECEDLLQAETGDPSKPMLGSYLAFIRISNFDPIAFCLCGDKILHSLEGSDNQQKAALLEILDKVRENIYTVQRDYNVYSYLGRIYYDLNCIDESLEALRQSVKLFGADSDALYHIAACHEVKGNYEAALSFYRQTQELDPGCTLTRDGIKRAEAGLAEQVALCGPPSQLVR